MSIPKQPYVVIGVFPYKPPFIEETDYNAIDAECSKIRGLLRGIFPYLYFNVRWPLYNMDLDSTARNWHHDCNGTSKEVVIWSTGPTTQVKFLRRGNAKIWSPQPFEVIKFDNKKTVHRAPKTIIEDNRWSAVSRVSHEDR